MENKGTRGDVGTGPKNDTERFEKLRQGMSAMDNGKRELKMKLNEGEVGENE